jgi:YidC/Oxa1 family membrane protein insertase
MLTPLQKVLEYIVVFLYNNVIDNYGIVIILLTLIVRVVLVPLTISQTRSMAKMQKLQPELKELQKKYKDDKQKLQQETMDFYSKNNVNPLSGCMPLILQMPVFIALFQTLRSPSEIITSVVGNFTLNGVAAGMSTGLAGFLNEAEIVTGVANPNYNFLWMNLNERDPYFILVILMVGTMFLSMKMTSTDSQQTKIMYIMPVAFGFISYQFPSGMLVYWVTSNVLSVAQQLVIKKIVTKETVKKELEKEGKNKEDEKELSEEEKRKIIKRIKKKKRRKK